MMIGLGSVQFGTDYGVSNASGRTSELEVGRILRLAAESGVEILDTAAAYGDSEAVIGRSLAAAGLRFSIITKLPPGVAAHEAEASTLRSLDRLGVPSIAGLMVHRGSDLLTTGGRKLWKRMERLRDAGLVGKIGVSIYLGTEVDMLLDRFPLELVQAPANVFDQRLLASGHLERLRDAGVEVHLRSAFLQGLLLADPESVRARFGPWRQTLLSYREWTRERGESPLEAALGFALGLPAHTVVIGVNNESQLKEVLSAAMPLPSGEFARWASDDPALVDPSTWGL
jgi:aryl-alcohol dehydrogenase-like predicted oxidoreductase